MSQCAGENCTHSSHGPEAAPPPEEVLEVRPVAPIQIETVATRRFEQLSAVRAAREDARKAAAAAPPAPAPPAPPEPPKYAPSDQVKGAQRILELIEQRKLERVRLVAEKLSRGLEFDRQGAEDLGGLKQTIAAFQDECAKKIEEAQAQYGTRKSQREWEITARQNEIDKLDLALVNLRKQLDAELGKLDPDLARPRKGA